jgi:peroxiredoxin
MRQYFYALICCLPFALYMKQTVLVQPDQPAVASAKEVLQKSAERLTKLKQITYQYTRILDYPSESYHSELAGTMMMDFASTDSMDFRYQFNHNNGFEIYNGTERFITTSATKKMTVNYAVSKNELNSTSCLFNSILTLRNSLPLLLKDTAVTLKLTDTLIGGRFYHNLHFDIKQKVFEYTGGYRSLTRQGLIIKNNLVIDKSTYLPVEFLSRNNQNADLNHPRFGQISDQPLPVIENSWYYSSYLSNYTISKPKDAIALIKSGQPAPHFSATDIFNRKTINLDNLKGQVVLLEFWIKNCSYCITAVPALNRLHQQFAKKGLYMAAINPMDKQDVIQTFIRKHAVNYPVYQSGKDTEQRFGIPGYPTAILIDKAGTIIHAGEMKETQLTQLIQEALKK